MTTTSPSPSQESSTNVRVRVPAAAKLAFRTVQGIHDGLAASLLERLFLTPPRAPLPTEEQAFLETGRHEQVDSPVGSLATWVWGEGRTVLLVHGWGSRASRYRTLVPALLESGHRVVAMESPGHGRSSGRRSSLPETAAAVRCIANRELERRGALPWGVIAHSFGSAAAILAQRDGVGFERNVFLAPSVDFDAYMERVENALGVKREVSQAMIRRVERRLGFSWDAISVSAQSPGSTARALIFHDPADAEVPLRDAEQLANAWPNAQLQLTPGLGHRRLMHDTKVINRIVDFLSDRSSSRWNALTAPESPSVSVRMQSVTPEWTRAVGSGKY